MIIFYSKFYSLYFSVVIRISFNFYGPFFIKYSPLEILNPSIGSLL
nr:MAG TPA: hypothetical protein [Caudoviricetes sp.]